MKCHLIQLSSRKRQKSQRQIFPKRRNSNQNGLKARQVKPCITIALKKLVEIVVSLVNPDSFSLTPHRRCSHSYKWTGTHADIKPQGLFTACLYLTFKTSSGNVYTLSSCLCTTWRRATLPVKGTALYPWSLSHTYQGFFLVLSAGSLGFKMLISLMSRPCLPPIRPFQLYLTF